MVHGDDFLSEGPGDKLAEMDAQMRKSFSLKTEVFGGEEADVNREAEADRTEQVRYRLQIILLNEVIAVCFHIKCEALLLDQAKNDDA